MWVNKVPNVHVWADHTSVQLLLEILTGALSRLTACLAEWNRNVWEEAAEKDPRCPKPVDRLYIWFSSRNVIPVSSRFRFLKTTSSFVWLQSESDPAMKRNKTHIQYKVCMKLYIWWPQGRRCVCFHVSKTPAVSANRSSTLNIFSSELRLTSGTPAAFTSTITGLFASIVPDRSSHSRWSSWSRFDQ